MGLLLLDAFEDEASGVFVPAGLAGIVHFRAPRDVVDFRPSQGGAMAEVFYDSWGPKDKNDRCSRNVTLGAFLSKVGGVYASATVFLDTDTGLNLDTALTFSGDPVYDASTKAISIIEENGTPGSKYLVTVRITLADTRQYDQSFWQEVRNN